VRLWIRDEFVDVGGDDDEYVGDGFDEVCGAWLVVGCWGEVDVVVVEEFKMSLALFWMKVERESDETSEAS